MLRDIGVHFETARTADEGLMKLQSERFDVMLLDYQLGNGETGVDMVNRARRNGIELPKFGVVAVSAHALTQVRNECKEAGFVDYLTKPFDSQSLTLVLMRVIEGANV
jgi:CheY-like chemotaxis protein